MAKSEIIEAQERLELPVGADEGTVLSGLSAYINAGGRGTRLSGVFPADKKFGLSKALLMVGRPPIMLIDHHINRHTDAGISPIVAGVGDHQLLDKYVRHHYGDRHDVHAISYDHQLGNGGDLIRAVRDFPDMFENDVLITNVDTILDIDEADFYRQHKESGAEITIALTRNRGVPNEDAFYVDNQSRVVYSREAAVNNISLEDAEARAVRQGSSTGALIARLDVLGDLGWMPDDGPLSIYGAIIGSVLLREGMFAYDNGTNLFTDIGTEDPWREAFDQRDQLAPHLHYSN